MSSGEIPVGQDGYFTPAEMEEVIAIGGIMMLNEAQWEVIREKDDVETSSEDESEEEEKSEADLDRERIIEEGYFSD